MNPTLAQYVIACIYNAPAVPTPESIESYLIEPLKDVQSLTVMHYRMLDSLSDAIMQNRAVDALTIFSLIWWDMTDSNAQHMFDLVKDMECDPDDDLGSHTVMHLSHTIIGKFPTLT